MQPEMTVLKATEVPVQTTKAVGYVRCMAENNRLQLPLIEVEIKLVNYSNDYLQLISWKYINIT